MDPPPAGAGARVGRVSASPAGDDRAWDPRRRRADGDRRALLADEAGLRAINATHNPTFASPSEFGPLGTDSLGRDVLTQFVWGARTSLLVGLAATMIAILIGSIVGITAGFYGGKLGAVLMRITEWFLVIPFLPWPSCWRRSSARL